MGLINSQVVQEYDALGWDATSSPANIKPGYVAECWNAIIGVSNGSYDKRQGTVNVLSTAWSGGTIQNGLSYYPTSGVQRILIGGAGNVSFTNTSGAAPTAIATGLSASARIGFIQPGSFPIYFNGTDNPGVYTGSGTRALGLAAPAAAPTFSGPSAGGSLTIGGSYIYFYTYAIENNGVVVAESSPSAPGTGPTPTVGNQTVTVNYTAAPASATHIYLYRTYAGTNQAFLEQSIAAPGPGSFTSSKPDSALFTRQLELDNTQLSALTSTANFAQVIANRVFWIVNDTDVRYSKISQSGPMYESYEVSAFARVASASGASDKPVGLGFAGDTPIVLKERSVGALDPSSAASQDAEDPVIYSYREIAPDVGAVSHWAQTSVFGERLWMARNGIFATDGRTVKNITPTLTAYFKTLSFSGTQTPLLSAVNDTANLRVMFTAFSSASKTVPDVQLVGDYRSYPEFKWTVWRPGLNPTTQPGIRATSLFLVDNPSTRLREVWAGDGAEAGRLLKLNTGTSDVDNTSGTPVARGIDFYVKSRAYNYGAASQIKLVKDWLFSARQDGGASGVTVTTEYDLSGVAEFSETFNIQGVSGEWDVDFWDAGPWTDTSTQLVLYAPHRKARFVQIAFRHTSQGSFSLIGWEGTASVYTVA